MFICVGYVWIYMLIKVSIHVWLLFSVKFISWAALSKKVAAILPNCSRKVYIATFIEILKMFCCDLLGKKKTDLVLLFSDASMVPV